MIDYKPVIEVFDKMNYRINTLEIAIQSALEMLKNDRNIQAAEHLQKVLNERVK